METASGAEVSGDSAGASVGATEAPGLGRMFGLRFSLGPGRRDAGRKPGRPRLKSTKNIVNALIQVMLYGSVLHRFMVAEKQNKNVNCKFIMVKLKRETLSDTRLETYPACYS